MPVDPASFADKVIQKLDAFIEGDNPLKSQNNSHLSKFPTNETVKKQQTTKNFSSVLVGVTGLAFLSVGVAGSIVFSPLLLLGAGSGFILGKSLKKLGALALSDPGNSLSSKADRLGALSGALIGSFIYGGLVLIGLKILQLSKKLESPTPDATNKKISKLKTLNEKYADTFPVKNEITISRISENLDVLDEFEPKEKKEIGKKNKEIKKIFSELEKNEKATDKKILKINEKFKNNAFYQGVVSKETAREILADKDESHIFMHFSEETNDLLLSYKNSEGNIVHETIKQKKFEQEKQAMELAGKTFLNRQEGIGKNLQEASSDGQTLPDISDPEPKMDLGVYKDLDISFEDPLRVDDKYEGIAIPETLDTVFIDEAVLHDILSMKEAVKEDPRYHGEITNEAAEEIIKNTEGTKDVKCIVMHFLKGNEKMVLSEKDSNGNITHLQYGNQNELMAAINRHEQVGKYAKTNEAWNFIEVSKKPSVEDQILEMQKDLEREDVNDDWEAVQKKLLEETSSSMDYEELVTDLKEKHLEADVSFAEFDEDEVLLLKGSSYDYDDLISEYYSGSIDGKSEELDDWEVLQKNLLGEMVVEEPILSEEEIKEMVDRDFKLIQMQCEKLGLGSLEALAKSYNGEYKKISRRKATDLSFSYLLSPEGKLFRYIHASQGSYLHQPKVSNDGGVIGEGAAKIAKKVVDRDGNVLIRGVMKTTTLDTSTAVAMTKIDVFRDSEYLLVGHRIKNLSLKRGEKVEEFIAPYMEGGEMGKVILPPEQVLKASLQNALGVKVMHDNKYIHGDIKPANVFYKLDEKGNVDAKLGDFDLALNINTIKDHEVLASCGTPGYMSPELMKGESKGQSGALQNDIFALGMHYFEISGFDLYRLFCQDCLLSDPTLSNKQINEEFEEMMKDFDYSLIKPAFDEFVRNNPERESLLNLAYKMVNPDPALRPQIDAIVANLEGMQPAT